MRKYVLILAMSLFLIFPAIAQKSENKSKEDMRKELHEFKLKYLAQEMDLNDDQKKPFFDIYEQLVNERREVRKTFRHSQKKLKNSKNLSNADYEAINKDLTAAKEKETLIEKKYDEKFSKFLSAKQIFKMKEAEEKWRAKMKEMRNQKD